MYHARRRLLTGNNWPQELGAFVSDSDSRPTHPHPWLAWSSPLPTPPTKHRDTQKRRPLVTPAVCFQMQCRNLQGRIMSPSRQTPFCIPASFHFFIIQVQRISYSLRTALNNEAKRFTVSSHSTL